MFSKGSRYQNLSESSPVDARGERVRCKNVRRIPRPMGTFRHTVHEGDRLDLLAFKYYGDSTKWWQISDANAEALFPTDLLNSEPVITERITLTHGSFVDRFYELIGEIEQITIKLSPSCQSLPLESLREFDANQLDRLQTTLAVLYSEPSFLSSTIVVIYPPSGSTRGEILGKIEDKGFHLLSAQNWTFGAQIAEAFDLDEPGVRQSWREIVDEVSKLRGVLRVQTNVLECSLAVAYNSTLVERAEILRAANGSGFQLQALRLSRIATNIVIPPNQIA